MILGTILQRNDETTEKNRKELEMLNNISRIMQLLGESWNHN